jgi:hypothetical protein
MEVQRVAFEDQHYITDRVIFYALVGGDIGAFFEYGEQTGQAKVHA